MITYVNVTGLHAPKLRLGDREVHRSVAVLSIAATGAVAALLANLLSPPDASPSTPAAAGATSFASDIAAIHAAFDAVSDFSVGSGFVEFEPPPSEPLTTVGVSHKTTQTHELGN